ncbi:MAG: LamG-like jellyroll fold domain-containing protein [bacterium]|nr:LamG-like jellyroll fold domain-containing protein [bacterium]
MSLKGFTLIELLVVIAVVGVLAGGGIVLIDPVGQLNKAKLAKGKSFHGQLTRTLGFNAAGTWTFNDASSPGFDTSGSNNHGTVTGATYVPNCDAGFGGCLSFDGVNDWVDIAQPAIQTSPNVFTVSAFINPGNQAGSLIITPNSAGIDQWIQYDATNKRLIVTIAEAGDLNIRARTSTNSSVPLNTWTHWGVSINNLTVKIYINGTLDSTYNESIPIAGWAGNWRIGQRGNSTFWYLGQLDDIQVFGQALSAAQIQKLYTQGIVKRYLTLTKNN